MDTYNHYFTQFHSDKFNSPRHRGRILLSVPGCQRQTSFRLQLGDTRRCIYQSSLYILPTRHTVDLGLSGKCREHVPVLFYGQHPSLLQGMSHACEDAWSIYSSEWKQYSACNLVHFILEYTEFPASKNITTIQYLSRLVQLRWLLSTSAGRSTRPIKNASQSSKESPYKCCRATGLASFRKANIKPKKLLLRY